MELFKSFVLGCLLGYFLVEICFFIKENISFKLKDIDEKTNYVVSSYIILTYHTKFRLCIITKFNIKHNDANVKAYHLFTLLFFK